MVFFGLNRKLYLNNGEILFYYSVKDFFFYLEL